MVLVLSAAAVFASGQIAQQKLTFESRYNLLADDPANNYFYWTLDRLGPNGSTERRVVRDAFDPKREVIPASHVDTQTGASAYGSTVEFNNAITVNGRNVFPQQLRQLMLYAVSPRSYAINEELRVDQQGKKLTFYWTHNANSAMLWTDDNGEFDLNDCLATLVTCERPTPETIKVMPQFLKAGADDSKKTSIDWTKVIPNMSKGGPNSPEFQYIGKATAQYLNGVIIIKGSFVLQPK